MLPDSFFARLSQDLKRALRQCAASRRQHAGSSEQNARTPRKKTADRAGKPEV